jgi:hypothetical protein
MEFYGNYWTKFREDAGVAAVYGSGVSDAVVVSGVAV